MLAAAAIAAESVATSPQTVSSDTHSSTVPPSAPVNVSVPAEHVMSYDPPAFRGFIPPVHAVIEHVKDASDIVQPDVSASAGNPDTPETSEMASQSASGHASVSSLRASASAGGATGRSTYPAPRPGRGCTLGSPVPATPGRPSGAGGPFLFQPCESSCLQRAAGFREPTFRATAAAAAAGWLALRVRERRPVVLTSFLSAQLLTPGRARALTPKMAPSV